MKTPESTQPPAPDAALIPAESSAVLLIREAIASKADPAQLRELLAVRREWESDEARKAYNAAIAEFQLKAPIVSKGDKGEKSDYAALDRIWREIRPLQTGLGLAVTWHVSELKGEGENAFLHLEGKLRHKLGHIEELRFDLPLPGIIKTRDGRAVTNMAQNMGSAVTYAKRYAHCAALGIVTGDDDDGRNAGVVLTIDEAQEKEILTLLDAARGIASFDEKKFWAWLGCATVRDIYKTHAAGVVEVLKKKIKGGAQ